MKKLLLFIPCLLLLINCKSNNNKNTETNQEQPNEQKMEQTAPEKNEERVKVLIQTSMGDMTIELFNETPLHRDNFLKLVNENFYDSLLFHRVIREFMIQGGDPESKNAPKGKQLGSGGLNYTVPAEFNSKFFHKKGALSAARLGDGANPKKASSSCQFYIVQGKKLTDQEIGMAEMQGFKFTPEQKEAYKTEGGTPWLDGQYTVYGQVIEGLDIIDKIGSEQTMPGDRPVDDVKIIKMTVIK